MLFRKFSKSLKFASLGFRFFIRERNIKIHLGAALTVILLGLFFGISSLEWVAIILSICLVISLEIVNTVIEEAMDLLNSEKNVKVMIVKDLSAAAVFVSAIGSIFVGLLVFIHYILKMLQ
ncbi:UDP kinase [bacterium CG_4_10_14_0_2_um_filter_33_32]|nr:MAG: hypothetical protein AUJ93_04035 [bacterium CG2_30_33_46]PIR67574.1 MAG: UDP kinase [bacterium CG10_big_fil_rev_8_21_14_0_10_33_18]PIU76448.1 MAG: UDP kinase [bacterium CG06_land_8_20_14_3_00_33_50]PIW81156.1 MAG: UDP kinase [bacterium CG_4_8_14_3_um_filter_33_28]PIY84886.1 MAG: UDP kinase [bacterium CG_4_10_14_0_8_um_filter_33_57]PIZ86513.1 MAG: UDP kinase [bacterium CG_4_10_14_0_2_um_filter_33_32]PJA71770.1 MAG: UDP kinase [bacterium CG_4_9_14_3_um_filter_33_26]